MNQAVQEELDNLRICYYEIIYGYSHFPEDQLYVKHFNELDNAKNLIHKRDLIRNYRKQGLDTEENKEKYLIENGLWTQEKKDRILQLKYIVFDNEKQMEKLIAPGQKDSIQILVDKDKEELAVLEAERIKLIEPTCESMAAKETENYLTFISCYKDKDLKIPYWEEGQFDQMDEIDLIKYKIYFRSTFERTRSQIIEKIACLPFFLNAFRLADKRPDLFFKKRIYELSYVQGDLMSYGMRNLNVLAHANGSPPSLIDNTPEDLIKWYDLQYSILKSKSEKD
jgi:hypothetical protein